jgi:hypothetical protein
MTKRTSLSSKTPGIGKFMVKRREVSAVVLMIMRAMDAAEMALKAMQIFLNHEANPIIFAFTP